MQNLYTISTRDGVRGAGLTAGEKFSVFYHDLFDFPLSFSEVIRWLPHRPSRDQGGEVAQVVHKKSFYYLKGREGLIYKRILRKRISVKKLEIAKSASKILFFLPGIKMVGVTGSLTMGNSTDDSDIDLMIVTKVGSLWTTRLFAYMVIHAFGFIVRKPNDWHQRDRLCLNMWFDESDLIWQKKDRNIYTAHEIGQILPLVNKDKTYEKFLQCNRWILGFWPNCVRVGSTKYAVRSTNILNTLYDVLSGWFEPVAFKLQYWYMKPKMTREVATATRALFHPQDWGRVVLDRIKSFS